MSNQPICDFLKLNKMVFLSFIILCIISSSYVSFQMKKKKKKKQKKKAKMAQYNYVWSFIIPIYKGLI